MNDSIKLTQFSSSSGCGCKIHPGELEEILKNLKTGMDFPNLIVGNSSADDASVMKLPNGDFLIQTSDFFTPIVDDPFLFGQIAAANALSDVFAMGGKPLMANALLGWPTDKLSPEIANQVLKGAIEICNRVNIPLAGGHSIKILEPIFGLSVIGICKPIQLKTNSGANAGDIIYITKPIGTGILASALKKGKLSNEGLKNLISVTTKVNSEGALFGNIIYISAMTDITGFGFLGHLLEMCKGANLGAEISSSSVPVIAEAKALAAQFIMPDNTYRNWNAFEKQTNNLPADLFALVNDPQTNGGLMVAVDKGFYLNFETFCEKAGITFFKVGCFNNEKGVQFK
ncbi:MAG: selenide, water dikinase SelD [Bacteroidia bacterium]